MSLRTTAESGERKTDRSFYAEESARERPLSAISPKSLVRRSPPRTTGVVRRRLRHNSEEGWGMPTPEQPTGWAPTRRGTRQRFRRNRRQFRHTAFQATRWGTRTWIGHEQECPSYVTAHHAHCDRRRHQRGCFPRLRQTGCFRPRRRQTVMCHLVGRRVRLPIDRRRRVADEITLASDPDWGHHHCCRPRNSFPAMSRCLSWRSSMKNWYWISARWC